MCLKSNCIVFAVSEVLVVKLRVELLAGIEEARRDAQPDVQALAATANRILLMETRDTK